MKPIRFHCIVLLEVLNDELDKAVLQKVPNVRQMVKTLYEIYSKPECFEYILSNFYTSTFRSAYADIMNELKISSIYQVHNIDYKLLYEIATKIANQKKREIATGSEFTFGKR